MKFGLTVYAGFADCPFRDAVFLVVFNNSDKDCKSLSGKRIPQI